MLGRAMEAATEEACRALDSGDILSALERVRSLAGFAWEAELLQDCLQEGFSFAEQLTAVLDKGSVEVLPFAEIDRIRLEAEKAVLALAESKATASVMVLLVGPWAPPVSPSTQWLAEQQRAMEFASSSIYRTYGHLANMVFEVHDRRAVQQILEVRY